MKRKRPIDRPENPQTVTQAAPCPWDRFETYRTTMEFSKLGRRGYKQHCGPTAITNALLSLDARNQELKGASVFKKAYAPADLFLEVARLGQRCLIYWNFAFFKRYGGGTFGPALGLYTWLSFRHFGIKNVNFSFRPLASRKALIHELDCGHLLVLQMFFNSTYGSHVVVCCGYEDWTEPNGRTTRYIKIADGWASRPRYMRLDQLRRFGFCSIEAF